MAADADGTDRRDRGRTPEGRRETHLPVADVTRRSRSVAPDQSHNQEEGRRLILRDCAVAQQTFRGQLVSCHAQFSDRHYGGGTKTQMLARFLLFQVPIKDIASLS